MKYPLSSPSISALEKRYVNEALDSGWISGTGGFVTRFEQALAAKVNRQHCIAVSNGTVALELALQALCIGSVYGGSAEDEVIVPALTFVAPAAAVRAVGAKPVFVDVELSTWQMSAFRVAKRITPRTKAIIAVDIIGLPCNYDELYLVADGIPIIEDAAEAHGARYEGRSVGSFGDITTFSFHSNKSVAGGEAGAVLTDSDELAAKMRLVANHGMTPHRPYWHDVVGRNYRLNNLTAAFLTGQVERWDELTTKRQQVAHWYDERLTELFKTTELARRHVPAWSSESCWLYTLWHPERDRILAHLRSCDIDTRAIWTPLCDLPLYAESCRGDYPNARRIGYSAFWLPTSAEMTESDVKYICEKLREVL